MLVLTVILLTLTLTAAGSPHATHKCACDLHHPEVRILECPSQDSKLVGYMYESDQNSGFHAIQIKDDPVCKPISLHVKPVQDWTAVIHYGKTGFVHKDTGLVVTSCDGTANMTAPVNDVCNMTSNTVPPSTAVPQTTHSKVQTTSTEAPTTTAATQKTIAPGTPSPVTPKPSTECAKLEIIHDIAFHQPVAHHNARKCSSGSYESEAVIMQYCHAPKMSMWRRGKRVLDNCNSIPRYTPISAYYGSTHIGQTAIFIQCKPNGELEILRQDCNQPMNVMTINDIADMYYVINW